MAYDTILYEVQDGIATITLNRPDKLNAFTAEMHTELQDALKAVEKDDSVRVLVFTGAGRAFCSGANLGGGTDMEAIGDTLRRTYNRLINRIHNLEKPVIAAVNGVAAGAGCSLALACDLRIVADAASFIMAFVRIGLVPDSGPTYYLTRLVGMGRALEMCLLGDKVTAEDALRWGMVNKVVPAADLSAAVADWAGRLAQGPRSVGLIKRQFYRTANMNLDEALEYEAYMQEIAASTADFREGVAAFLEKRQARFTGR